MNDDSPFASFVPSTETPAAPETPAKNKGKRVRKGKGTKAAKVEPAEGGQVTPAKLKKARKARAVKTAEMKFPLSAVAILGALKIDDMKLFAAMCVELQKLPKKSRKQVAHALYQTFA